MLWGVSTGGGVKTKNGAQGQFEMPRRGRPATPNCRRAGVQALLCTLGGRLPEEALE